MLLLNAKEVIQLGTKRKYKNRSAITNDRVSETVVLHHYVDNYFYKFYNMNDDLDQLIIDHFG